MNKVSRQSPIAPTVPDTTRLPGEIGQESIPDLDAPQGQGEEIDDALGFLDETLPEDGVPQGTPQDASVDDEDEDEDDEEPEPEGDPNDPERIRKIVEQFKGNPEALAKSVLHAQREISRKANELAALKGGKAAPTPTTPEPEPEEQPEQVAGTLSFEIPDATSLYDPATDAISDRGYPTDPNTGKEYIPHDDLGVPYQLPEYYEAKAREFEASGDDGIRAVFKAQALQRRDEAIYVAERQRREAEFFSVQEFEGQKHVPELAAEMSRHFGKAVAEQIAAHFYHMGRQGVLQHRQVNPAAPELRDPGVVKAAMELYYFQAFRTGELLQLAEQVAARIKQSPQGTAPTPQPQVRQRVVMAPPIGGNGVGGSDVMSKEERRLVRAAGISPQEAKRLMQKDYDFGD